MARHCLQPCVVEEQVDEELIPGDLQADLTPHEGETRPQFEQESGDVPDQGVFDVAFKGLVGEPEEVEVVGVLEDLGSEPGLWRGGAEERPLVIDGDAGGRDVLVEIFLQGMVGGHVVLLAAFLLEAEPPAFALGVVVLDAHGDDGSDAGEGEEHRPDQGPVAEADKVGHPGVLVRWLGRSITRDGDALQEPERHSSPGQPLPASHWSAWRFGTACRAGLLGVSAEKIA